MPVDEFVDGARARAGTKHGNVIYLDGAGFSDPNQIVTDTGFFVVVVHDAKTKRIDWIIH